MSLRFQRMLQGTAVWLTGIGLGVAWAAERLDEQERKIKESEVPAAALKTLKGLAGAAKLTEFAEEKEHGLVYYEGSWKGPQGHVDALVTAEGDLVEIEEQISLDRVPRSVLEKSRQAAGPDVTCYFEKKTVYFYEVKFRRGDKRHEILYSADGRSREQEVDNHGDQNDD